MYAFLSQPPPSKKTTRRVVPAPLSPSRANSNAISTWAATVFPGSPAPCSPSSSPCSPAVHRRNSVGRRPSLTLSHRRRPSIGQRTPSTAEYRPDLTALGYNSLFVQFDKTPTTPSPFRPRNTNTDWPKVAPPLTSDVFGSIPIPPVPQAAAEVSASTKRSGPLRRFRSLSILRSKKSKYNQVPHSIPSPTKLHKSKGSAIKQPAKQKATAPPSLANDIALMQFIGGGSVEDNVKKVMQARSKAVAKSASGREALEDVYRDGKGGIWYDKDEEMEYAHLLSFEDEWVEVSEEETSPGISSSIPVKASSPYTNAYCPLDVVTIHRTPTSMTSSTASSPRSDGRSRPLLSRPSRPRCRHASHSHLTHPPSFILDLNLDAVGAFIPRTPRTPKSPRRPSISATVPPTMSQSSAIRMKHRPRPAPLNLTSTQSAHARANAKVLQNQQKKGAAFSIAGGGSVGLSSQALEEARREFVENSFKPVLGQGMETKVSDMADVRDVFR